MDTANNYVLPEFELKDLGHALKWTCFSLPSLPSVMKQCLLENHHLSMVLTLNTHLYIYI